MIENSEQCNIIIKCIYTLYTYESIFHSVFFYKLSSSLLYTL